MTAILHIDSSILGKYSVSRALTAAIVARQQTLHQPHDLSRTCWVSAVL